MTVPKHTNMDARRRPIPGDKYVYKDGGVWTVTSVVGARVHFEDEKGTPDEIDRMTWSKADGLGTWVPA